jgi:group I intron endonuclease
MSISNGNVIWEEKNLTRIENNYLNSSVSEQSDIIKDINIISTKNPCKDTGKISGIYKIVNKTNGKYYVGSSMDIRGKPHGRFYQHNAHLKSNRHYNSHLQRAWNKYGEDCFEFIVIEKSIPDKTAILELEQKYLDIAKNERHKCYNQSFKAHLTIWSDSAKSSRSRNITGENNPNYGNGNKIKGEKNPFYGKIHSDETKPRQF